MTSGAEALISCDLQKDLPPNRYHHHQPGFNGAENPLKASLKLSSTPSKWDGVPTVARDAARLRRSKLGTGFLFSGLKPFYQNCWFDDAAGTGNTAKLRAKTRFVRRNFFPKKILQPRLLQENTTPTDTLIFLFFSSPSSSITSPTQILLPVYSFLCCVDNWLVMLLASRKEMQQLLTAHHTHSHPHEHTSARGLIRTWIR